jgi:hypothetical protein
MQCNYLKYNYLIFRTPQNIITLIKNEKEKVFKTRDRNRISCGR